MNSNIVDVVRAVKLIRTLLLSTVGLLLEPFRPVIRAGEVYSLDQTMWRLRIGDKTLRSWEADGLRVVQGVPGTGKKFYRGDDLLKYLDEKAAIPKTM